MFVDTTRARLEAGKGGDGCLSFRREAFIPKGGPDGGDGGKGGSVFLLVTRKVATLNDVARRHAHQAENGRPGQGKDKTGRGGKSLELRVPPGTVVRDADSGEQLYDLVEEGKKIQVARGGQGGRGNKSYATATNQVPRQYTRGEPGGAFHLVFELKLIADVGLVGLPNVGKSSILRNLSGARPASRAYPFTTLKPALGVVSSHGRERVWADLPGLIEGAHRGRGLGDEFLRHVERTRVLVHVLDAASSSGLEPEKAYAAIREELASYSSELASKPEVVVLNKTDLVDEASLDDPLRLQAQAFQVSAESDAPVADAALGEQMAKNLAIRLNKPVIAVSARTGKGLAELAAEATRQCGHDENDNPDDS